MRKWILAAVAALAVGQAEAATYELTYRLDYARLGFEDHSNPDDNSSSPLPDAAFFVKLVYEAEEPSLPYGSTSLISGLQEAQATFSNPMPWGGGEFTFPSFMISLVTGPDLTIRSVYMRFTEGGAFGFVDGSEGFFSPYGYDDFVTFKGRWTLKDLDAPQVPLPASAPLMLAGLIGLGVIRRAGSQSAT